MAFPVLIQGGMGAAISDWRLAKAVAQCGQLGVVSGTGMARVLASRLMDGDPQGHIRRALASFPHPEPVQEILERYFVPGGKAAQDPYGSVPVYTVQPSRFLDQLTVIANYAEVFLAKEGHEGIVGINLLEKIQMPTLASLYGAMLAGVDYVLMGAGIPTQIAEVLNKLVRHEAVSYRLDVRNATAQDEIRIHFDAERIFPGLPSRVGALRRPQFLPIISSVALAQALLKRSEGAIAGFVIEGPTAGGHNAPPRGPLKLSERGEPIYGEKDVVDLEKIKQLGLPFWLAGGFGHADQVKQALAAGAQGVQVGTVFALCEESGMERELKKRVLRHVLEPEATTFTDPVISPTGFPFNVAQIPGTMSERSVYDARERICDLGFLRTIVKAEDGSILYRCPAEPVEDYLRKGGEEAETLGRTCLCNNLLATAGFPQQRKHGYLEAPIVTLGEDIVTVRQFLREGRENYSAQDVVRQLLA